jgi:hypothetical protein
MAGFYEVVHSRLQPGSEEAMLALRPRFVAAIRAAAPGLRDAQLVQLDDGSWLDIVQWDSREAAEAGVAAHGSVPEAVEMGQHISEVLAIHQGAAAEPVASGR